MRTFSLALAWGLGLSFLPHSSSVSLYYCNSSFLTTAGPGMIEGMYLVQSTNLYGFSSARDFCKSLSFPLNMRNVSFVSDDLMMTNPSAFQPSLASLSNINNFNIWMSAVQSTGSNYWVGLSQDVNYSNGCQTTALPNIYENSFNWTWFDGTPLLRDSKGQGLPFFTGTGEPNGNGHYGVIYLNTLFDSYCTFQAKALCSIPRKLS
jgi:hypothetical protein